MSWYRGHKIVKDEGRFKTFAPKRQSLVYTGSFNSLARARRWVDEQERAWAEMTNQAARASNADSERP